MFKESTPEQALAALKNEPPHKAKEKLEDLIAQNPERIDLHHALTITLLQMGEAQAAKIVSTNALALSEEIRTDMAATMETPLLLSLANAHEDLYEPKLAEQTYQKILSKEADHPYARQRYAYLLLAWGRYEDALTHFSTYIESALDEPGSIDAHKALVKMLAQFERENVHPKNFIEAHRESYVMEFDKIADDLVNKGWYAEAARMNRDEDGSLRPIIPDGARPYAAIRVDVVNPQTGQPGRIGEGPFVVAIENYEMLAQAAFISKWPGYEFDVYVSSVCPWNNLSVHIRMAEVNLLEVVDEYIGDWYEAGYNGAFGQTDRGMLHEVTDPMGIDERSVQYYVDCGRAQQKAVKDLLSRLETLHSRHPIESVLFGRGYLPDC